MIPLGVLLEQLDQHQNSPLMDSGEESGAMSVVRAGQSLRDKDEASFWDDFRNLCANREGLAELLGVQPEIVSKWTQRIQEILERIEKHDQQHGGSEDEEKEMMPTGETGAVTRERMGPFGMVRGG